MICLVRGYGALHRHLESTQLGESNDPPLDSKVPGASIQHKYNESYIIST